MSLPRTSQSSPLDKELNQLRVPDEEAQAHSEKLISRIRDEIDREGGSISFARYMDLALFAPGLGYYSAGSRKFGGEGDFVTAPEISSLFSRTLAHQVAEVLGNVQGGKVLEVGAGSGVMAADMLAELEHIQCLPEAYLVLELSADLRERQRQLLADRVPHLLDRVQWLDELPTSGFRGVVVANELLDALPVHCFCLQEGDIRERYVTWQDGRFQWQTGEPETLQLKERIIALAGDLPEGYQSEINLAAKGWLASIAQMLEAGVVLLLDYGFPRREFYHPQRMSGTLMCHYRHRAHDDPFVFPGLQDITAHVDFTAVAEAAVDADLTVNGYTSQGYFLLANGITGLAENLTPDAKQQVVIANQVRTLTMPDEMGELFKVMALGKDYDAPLTGFSLHDARHKL
jgi:SAM-dependent MidA family methyltransferase